MHVCMRRDKGSLHLRDDELFEMDEIVCVKKDEERVYVPLGKIRRAWINFTSTEDSAITGQGHEALHCSSMIYSSSEYISKLVRSVYDRRGHQVSREQLSDQIPPQLTSILSWTPEKPIPPSQDLFSQWNSAASQQLDRYCIPIVSHSVNAFTRVTNIFKDMWRDTPWYTHQPSVNSLQISKHLARLGLVNSQRKIRSCTSLRWPYADSLQRLKYHIKTTSYSEMDSSDTQHETVPNLADVSSHSFHDILISSWLDIDSSKWSSSEDNCTNSTTSMAIHSRSWLASKSSHVWITRSVSSMESIGTRRYDLGSRWSSMGIGLGWCVWWNEMESCQRQGWRSFDVEETSRGLSDLFLLQQIRVSWLWSRNEGEMRVKQRQNGNEVELRRCSVLQAKTLSSSGC